MCNDARLPAARACKNQDRAFVVATASRCWGFRPERKSTNNHFTGEPLHWVGVSYIKVASLRDLPPGGLLEIELNNHLYAICNVAGEIRAMHGICPIMVVRLVRARWMGRC